jgi:MSHA biogenesis protein MshM
MSEVKESRIGRWMQISGDVECTNPVVLEGKIEGSFAGGSLLIGETGQLLGLVSGDSIECLGRIEGDIITRSLRLRETACHVGTVETLELEVEPGAILDCALQSGTLKSSAATSGVEEITEKPPIDTGELLLAFREESRPCCMDVPWSERLELYSHLLELLEKGKALIKVTGERGSGKTVLVEKLRKSLPETYTALRVSDQVGSVASLLQTVALDLGIEEAGGIASPHELLARIKPFLDAKRECGQRVVLLVDDAQKMYPATMEGLTRLLTNGYGVGDQLMQVILVGTKEMEAKMVATTLEYFEDETNCQLILDPLTIKDTADYLRYCLQLASKGDGARSVALFPNKTIKAIHVRSRGNIAAINSLAEKALQHVHASGAAAVNPSII